MAVRYKDYYALLGVDRRATPVQIQKAFRAAARKYHPDVSKAPGAEQRYQDINEAYEVLKDPEKRAQYDALGEQWQEGQDFVPPSQGYRRSRTSSSEMPFGDFSDFFNAIFGGGFPRGGFDGFSRQSGNAKPRKGDDAEFALEVTLEEAQKGCLRSIALEDGNGARRTLEVRIPPGVAEGSRVRVPGKGNPGLPGEDPGDLYFRITLRPDARFAAQGHDLRSAVDVAPWEAALGGEIPVNTLSGDVRMKIPPGTQGNQVFRLRGKGLPRRRGEPGDLYVTVRIAIPRQLSPRERELFEDLARSSSFRPRGS